MSSRLVLPFAAVVLGLCLSSCIQFGVAYDAFCAEPGNARHCDNPNAVEGAQFEVLSGAGIVSDPELSIELSIGHPFPRSPFGDAAVSVQGATLLAP